MEKKKVASMNREQRRALQKGNKQKIAVDPLSDQGKEFIQFAEDNNADMNVFFKMFSLWLNLPSSQKNTVIVECIRQGKIELEEGNNAEQSSEGE